jgi:hypothetical protein
MGGVRASGSLPLLPIAMDLAGRTTVQSRRGLERLDLTNDELFHVFHLLSLTRYGHVWTGLAVHSQNVLGIKTYDVTSGQSTSNKGRY